MRSVGVPGLAAAAGVVLLGTAVVVVTLRGLGDSRSDQSGVGPVAAASGWRLGPEPGEQVIDGVYTTGYTWFDNTPPGSGRISHPSVHLRAGGTGNYADPVTMAVGHSLGSGSDVLDVPVGTRFYVPHVRRYFVVEDTCGNGPSPQRAGCHDLSTAPKGARLWVDLYVGGGEGDTRSQLQACAGTVTDGDRPLHVIVANPRADYPVTTGPLFQDGACTDLFSGGPAVEGDGSSATG